MLRSKLASGKGMLSPSRRLFSNYQVKPPNFNNTAGWALVGAGAAGIGYLLLKGRNLQYSRTQATAFPAGTDLRQGYFFSMET